MSCYFGKIQSGKADAWEEKKEVKKKIQEIHIYLKFCRGPTLVLVFHV